MNSKKYVLDFSWGDAIGVREVMMKYAYKILNGSDMPWGNFGYPAHEGEAPLIEQVKILIKKLTGNEYKYVLITNGASQALNAYVAAKKSYETKCLYTGKLYFPFYPEIAKNQGLTHLPSASSNLDINQISILDSPSNPEGTMHMGIGTVGNGIVWDAAYYSPTYCGIELNGKLDCIKFIPTHEAMAGSLNKLTGITGLRVGWLATNNQCIYEKAVNYVASDTCGVSFPSQYAAYMILKHVDLDSFYKESKRVIDCNRTEVARLSSLFGNQPIPKTGMFVLFEVDDKLKQLLEKASVKVMSGSACGDSRDTIRINLGHTNKATRAMVNAVIKADKRNS